VRFGDPEAQVLMVRLVSDLLPALIAAHDGVLRQVDLRWRADPALCVVMAAKGYPEAPQSGGEIRGLAAAAAEPAVKIFHAGTRRAGDRLLAAGGRVLGVTARGGDLGEARRRALPRSTGSTGRGGGGPGGGGPGGGGWTGKLGERVRFSGTVVGG
jgi:phosphoribosylamine--glycine ligase